MLLSGRSSTHLRNWRINTQQRFSTVASFVCYKTKYSGPVSQPVEKCLCLDRNRLRFHAKEIWARTGHTVCTQQFHGAVIALIFLVPGALNTESCSFLNQTLGKPTGVSGCWQQKRFLGHASPLGGEWGCMAEWMRECSAPQMPAWPHRSMAPQPQTHKWSRLKTSLRTENSNSWALTFLCKGSLLTTLQPWWICSQQALCHFILLKSIYFMYLFYLAALALSCSMWDLVPWLGIKPRALALGAQSLATGPPGKSTLLIFGHPALSLLKRKYLTNTWPFILECFSGALDLDKWNPRGNSWVFFQSRLGGV